MGLFSTRQGFVNAAATALARTAVGRTGSDGPVVHGDALLLLPLGTPFLYRLLRERFVRNHRPSPLSSDGFSRFGQWDAWSGPAHNAALQEATRVLHER